MKISKLLVIITVFTLFSCKEEPKTSYLISGEAKDIYNGIRVYLNELGPRGNLVVIDTAVVVNEQFAFEGAVEEPKMNVLTIQSVPGRFPFMIENNDISIAIDKAVLLNSRVTGSQTHADFKIFQDKMANLKEQIKALNEQYSDANFYKNSELAESTAKELETLIEEFNEYPYEFVAAHKSSFASFQALEPQLRNRDVNLDKLTSSFESLDYDLKISSQGVLFNTKLEDLKVRIVKARATDVGKKAPDFSAPTPTGEQLALSEVYSKGKYTIVDFWAAWCGPCRRENPNIVKIYNEYHDQGLEILGVSLDGRRGQQKPKEAWLKAIEDDQLTWNHVSNLEYFGPITKQYNVRSIPAMFILDSNGTIVAKNLRGPSLANKIKELLSP